MRHSLRTVETAQKYQNHKASGAMDRVCVLCSAPSLQTYMHWKVINNDFPYDRITEVHHMLIPVRHVTEDLLTQEERDELFLIKESDVQDYDFIIETIRLAKSIPQHFHVHLVFIKELDAPHE